MSRKYVRISGERDIYYPTGGSKLVQSDADQHLANLQDVLQGTVQPYFNGLLSRAGQTDELSAWRQKMHEWFRHQRHVSWQDYAGDIHAKGSVFFKDRYISTGRVIDVRRFHERISNDPNSYQAAHMSWKFDQSALTQVSFDSTVWQLFASMEQADTSDMRALLHRVLAGVLENSERVLPIQHAYFKVDFNLNKLPKFSVYKLSNRQTYDGISAEFHPGLNVFINSRGENYPVDIASELLQGLLYLNPTKKVEL